MKSHLNLLLLVLATGSAVSCASVRDPSQPSEDLFIIGQIERNEPEVESLDDLGMNVVVTAQLRILRVDAGIAPSKQLKVRYIAHSYLAEGTKHRLHLRLSDDGVYRVCSDGAGRGFICE